MSKNFSGENPMETVMLECPRCGGIGLDPESAIDAEPCLACDGRGLIRAEDFERDPAAFEWDGDADEPDADLREVAS
jgi:DnaJ-class molecular chaperone